MQPFGNWATHKNTAFAVLSRKDAIFVEGNHTDEAKSTSTLVVFYPIAVNFQLIGKHSQCKERLINSILSEISLSSRYSIS